MIEQTGTQKVNKQDNKLNNQNGEAVTATSTSDPTTSSGNSQSILDRVAKFQQGSTAKLDDIQFDPKDFDKIESVEDAKNFAMNSYKSFEKGFQKKFQDVAELRKTLEDKVNQSKSWTPDRIQTLLQDPAFVSAAQGMLNQSSYTNNDDYSTLSDSEKRRIDAIEQQNRLLIQQQSSMLKQQQDELLRSKYPNYKSEAVDTVTADMLAGKINNVREYIWKAVDFEDSVNRAYHLGVQDGNKQFDENVESLSYTGRENIMPSSTIKKEKGESNESLLKRLYNNAIRNRQATRPIV